MNLIKRLLSFIGNGVIDAAHVKANVIQDVIPAVQPEQLDKMIELLSQKYIVDVADWAKKLGCWKEIPPVKITAKFPGYAFVEGRNAAFEIDSDLHMFEYDSCIDFVSVMVIVNGVPSIDIEKKRGTIAVSEVLEEDSLSAYFNRRGHSLVCANSLASMPDHMQAVMMKILGRVLQAEELRHG